MYLKFVKISKEMFDQFRNNKLPKALKLKSYFLIYSSVSLLNTWNFSKLSILLFTICKTLFDEILSNRLSVKYIYIAHILICNLSCIIKSWKWLWYYFINKAIKHHCKMNNENMSFILLLSNALIKFITLIFLKLVLHLFKFLIFSLEFT